MYKPNSLRQHLINSNQHLRENPDKLLIFVDEGHIISSGTSSLSFQYAYRLNVIITDFGGEENSLLVPLLAWLKHHQHDLFAHPNKQDKGLRFMVDINNHQSIDLSLEIDMTESVIVKQEGNKLTATSSGDIVPTPVYTDDYWQLYSGNNLLAEWRKLDAGNE